MNPSAIPLKSKRRRVRRGGTHLLEQGTHPLFHEIRNHLTALSALAQLLPRKKNDQVFLDAFQELLSHEIDILMRLTETPKKNSDLEKGKVALVDFSLLLEQTIRLMTPLFRKKRIRVGSRVSPGLTLQGGEPRLEGLILNLLRNAVDSVGIEGRIQVTATRWRGGPRGSREWMRLLVQDNGPGIPGKDLAKIFEPYFSTKKDGTGLGLALCHEIVAKLGGTITAKNSSKKGALFTVLLPLFQPHETH